MAEHKRFFDTVRPALFGGHMSDLQVKGVEAILEAVATAGITDNRWTAYMLGTSYLETAHTMQPISEIGHGKGRKYGVPTGPFKQVYYGRGYVQLTWDFNYQKAQQKLGLPFLQHPELALVPKNAADIMIIGMKEGWFTGKKLADYFHSDGTADWVNARRIINGNDRAADIAGYAKNFLAAIEDAV